MSLFGTIFNAAVGFVGQGWNAHNVRQSNTQNYQQNMAMYNQQVRDNERQWHMQNEYNSPQMQMQRLREAGLNPNLVYGKGADATSAPMRGATPSASQVHAPRVDLSAVGDIMGKLYDLRIKRATEDNLRKQNTVLAEDALLKDAQRQKVLSEKSKIEFGLNLDTDLRDTYIGQHMANRKKTEQEIDINIAKEARSVLQDGATLKETIQRTLNNRRMTNAQIDEINSRIRNLKLDEKLKQLDINLKAKGIYPGDPWYMRIGARVFDEVIPQVLDKQSPIRHIWRNRKKYAPLPF